MHYIDVAKLVKSIQYRSLLAASSIAIVCTGSPVWAHAPEYHAPSENEEVFSPTHRPQATPEPTPNLSESQTNSQTNGTDLQLSPAENKSASRLPTGEFVLLLLVAGPWIMVSFKQRWQHNHK